MTERARRSAHEGNDIDHVVPGLVSAFADVDHPFAPAGNRGWVGQRLQLETADEIKQSSMLGANVGQLDAFAGKPQKQQRTGCVELLELAYIERTKFSLLYLRCATRLPRQACGRRARLRAQADPRRR